MTSITIPKGIGEKKHFVAVPRETYREFLAWQRKVKSAKEYTPIAAEKRALARARKNLAEGNTLSIDALKQKLGIKDWSQCSETAQVTAAKQRGRIIEVIELLPVNPYAGDIEKMKGESDVWRRRIGSHRVQYTIKTRDKIVNVFDVKRRTSATY